MRNTIGPIFSVALGVLTCGFVAGQDAAKPAVRVEVRGDGSIRVFDAKSGQELPSVVTRVPNKSTVQVTTPDGVLGAIRHDDARGIRVNVLLTQEAEQAALDHLRKRLEELKKAGSKDDGPRFQFQIGSAGQGQPKVIVLQKKIVDMKPESVDAKIDRLLKEMGELRKDVNDLKAKLDGGGPGRLYWQQFGPYFTPKKDGDKEKKATPGVGVFEIELKGPLDAKMLEEMLKKFGIPSDVLREKKMPDKAKPAPKESERSDLERRIDRILEEAEALQREIRKAKSK